MNIKTNIEELHAKFTEYGANARQWKHKCAMLLPDIEKYEVWKEKGFYSIYEYAAKLAGFSRLQVDETLRVLRKLEDKPALLEIANNKGIQAVRPVAVIATVDDQQYWAGQADLMSKHELETFVKDMRKNDMYHNEPIARETVVGNNQVQGREQTETVVMELKPKTVARLRKIKSSDWESLMEEFINLREKDMERTKPKAQKTNSRHIPAAIERYVLRRAGDKCEFPGCGKKWRHLHHTNRFASDKMHDPDQIVALCEAHHRLAHRGLIARENLPVENWEIRRHPDLADINRFIDDKVQFYWRK